MASSEERQEKSPSVTSHLFISVLHEMLVMMTPPPNPKAYHTKAQRRIGKTLSKWKGEPR